MIAIENIHDCAVVWMKQSKLLLFFFRKSLCTFLEDVQKGWQHFRRYTKFSLLSFYCNHVVDLLHKLFERDHLASFGPLTEISSKSIVIQIKNGSSLQPEAHRRTHGGA